MITLMTSKKYMVCMVYYIILVGVLSVLVDVKNALCMLESVFMHYFLISAFRSQFLRVMRGICSEFSFNKLEKL